MNLFLEYLEQAILSTKCDNIRASLIVQRNHNIDQIEFLKQRLHNQARKNFNRLSGGQTNKTVEQLINRPNSAMNLQEFEQKYQELHHVMNKQNQLLNCLITQRQPNFSSQSSNRSSPTEELKSNNNNNKSFDNKKQPENDKEIIEELKTINEKLHHWVHHMVENLEKAQLDLQNLKEENNQLRKELFLKNNIANNNNNNINNNNNDNNISELPPMEPPTLVY